MQIKTEPLEDVVAISAVSRDMGARTTLLVDTKNHSLYLKFVMIMNISFSAQSGKWTIFKAPCSM